MTQLLNDTVFVETKYGKIYSWQDDMITRQLQRFSAHTRNEIAMLGDFIRKGDSVIDVGAHIGTFTLPFAIFTGIDGEVLSIEGSTKNFDLLRHNIAINQHQNVILRKAVVSDSKHSFVMHSPLGGNTGAYQFIHCENASDPEAVHSLTLDEIIDADMPNRRIDLLKVDVEGCEMDVLKGASEMLSRDTPALYVEINKDVLNERKVDFTEILNFLRDSGYHLFRNIGHRNSTIDRYSIEKITSFDELPDLFDVLAISPNRNDLYGRLSSIMGEA